MASLKRDRAGDRPNIDPRQMNHPSPKNFTEEGTENALSEEHPLNALDSIRSR
jgi:hypothetical protein